MIKGNLELSEWECYRPDGVRYRPLKGQEPNWFWRWMQYICFGSRWVKND